MIFENRQQAGRLLAEALKEYAGKEVLVLALPRGGVVLGYEVAKALGAPLDLVITKKISHPLDPEYALCAVAEEGEPLCSEDAAEKMGREWLEDAALTVRREIRRRREAYCGNRPSPDIRGKAVIVVDDGIATGLTMMAAIQEVRSHEPKELIVAIPVTPGDTARRLEALADRLVSLKIDEAYLGYVGAYYMDFSQVEDEEVRRLLGAET